MKESYILHGTRDSGLGIRDSGFGSEGMGIGDWGLGNDDWRWIGTGTGNWELIAVS